MKLKIEQEDTAQNVQEPVKIMYPDDNPIIAFIKKQKIYIFVALILASILVVFLTAQPNGTNLNSQLKTDISQSLPDRDITSITEDRNFYDLTVPVTAIPEGTDTTSGSGILLGTIPTEGTGSAQVGTIAHDKFLNELQNPVVDTSILKESAPKGTDSSKTGPELLIVLFVSFLVTGSLWGAKQLYRK